jgi:hypothetical protein
MNIRQWLSVCFIIFILTVSAHALDDDDYPRLNNLSGKFLRLGKDLTNVEREILHGNSRTKQDLLDCLEPFDSHVERAGMSIGFLTELVSVVSLMVDKSDEKAVLSLVGHEAKSFLNYVEVGRKHINNVTGVCSRYDVVTDRAKEVIRLYDEATPLVQSIWNQSKP